jgi:magnesium-transporting ATPase (P-type)
VDGLISNPNDSKEKRNSELLVLRILWGAIVGSILLFGFAAYVLSVGRSANPEDNTFARTPVVTNFAQALQTTEFQIFFVASILLVYLSRFFPKMIFKAKLKAKPAMNASETIVAYFAPMMVGLAMLEGIAVMGFVYSFLYYFFPVYLLFGFIALSNALIRFPTENGIRGLAEYLAPSNKLGKY